jgi:endo-1,3(4)-beta-glucanase
VIRRRLTALAGTFAVLVLAGCSPSTPAATWSTGESVASPDLAGLPERSIADVSMPRLADGVVPPTNRWYSGLVFGDEPQPVFPFPLAFAARDDGFALELPAVTSQPNTIAAPFTGGLDVAVGSTSFQVVRHDPVSVTLEYSDDEGSLGRATVAEGSPVVTFAATRDTVLGTSETLRQVSDGLWETNAAGVSYGVLAPGSALGADGLRVAEGATAQLFAIPEDSTAQEWGAALTGEVSDVEVSYSVDAETASTRLVYAGGDQTVLVPFPATDGGEPCELGSFATAYGTARACAADALEWSVPRLEARSAYDLEGLDQERRDEIVDQLAADISALTPAPADTYFGGKSLARLAGFLSLARALGENELADRAADRLWEDLQPWIDAEGCETRGERCFVYDAALRTVVGMIPSFGSEEGNDHHFHYGYFLSAGAAIADYRPETLEALAPVLDILAADVAAGAEDDALPGLRAFDPYRGHSWASGLSPFADGNNQESSSEAVGAWNGLALWARASGDDALAERAEWMLSHEAASALSLWLEPDLAGIPDGYEHGIVSLSWGGKRDYATWFSPEPSAILGIQVLPVGPVSLDYLAGSPERVEANVAEAGGAGAFSGPLGDYVLMYSALGGDGAVDAAEAAARELSPDELDDGNSKSAMLAWTAAVRLAGTAPSAP